MTVTELAPTIFGAFKLLAILGIIYAVIRAKRKENKFKRSQQRKDNFVLLCAAVIWVSGFVGLVLAIGYLNLDPVVALGAFIMGIVVFSVGVYSAGRTLSTWMTKDFEKPSLPGARHD
jgi:uncharacterized membrane protein YiaA